MNKKIRLDKKQEILNILNEENNWQEEKFIPGKTLVRYAGTCIDREEFSAFIDSALEGWFGMGSKAIEFENNIAKYIGLKYSIFTNSGSSANLLAISALTSQCFKDKRVKDNEEAIVGAFCFPTTTTPLFFNNIRPRFIDVELGSYSMLPENIEKAITKKTRIVIVTHHFGNPNKIEEISEICRKNNLFLIEDCCDALGSEYNGKKVGSFGIASTYSFYPAHHITTGEGGMVLSDNVDLFRIARSMKTWGSGCYCDSRSEKISGCCGKRFSGKFGDLPTGYDHKYVYEQKGLNLKPLEQQAAIGIEQFKKLPLFLARRKENFNEMNSFFKNYKDFFILPETVDNKAKPHWFCYPLTIKTNKFTRSEIINYLEEHKIQTRPFFTGNIIRHPFIHDNLSLRRKCSISGKLINSDIIAENSFFLGIYPGIDKPRRDYIMEVLDNFLKKYS
jgi:CDP-6-deoxy-D-xylo-4-hexulose-3-dehydrase